MKLYVDDLRECPDGWHLARTITEAIRLLSYARTTEVSLDHDIHHASGDTTIVQARACPETFEAVAWYLAAIKFPGQVFIHTANPAGALRMAGILQDAGVSVQINEPRGYNP